MTHRVAAAAIALLLIMSCRSTTGDDNATTPPPPEPAAPATEVIAFLDKIERNAYQDFLEDRSVISWTVVTFTIVEPESAWGTTLQAYCAGHPFVDEKPLLVGTPVTFKMPPKSAGSMHFLEHLGLKRYVRARE